MTWRPHTHELALYMADGTELTRWSYHADSAELAKDHAVKCLGSHPAAARVHWRKLGAARWVQVKD